MRLRAGSFMTHSLRQSPWGEKIGEIMAEGMRAADPALAIKKHVQREGEQLVSDHLHLRLADHKRIFVIGVGKAVVPMANGLVAILGENITSGLLITKDGYLDPDSALPKNIKILQAAHPVPGPRNLEATSSLLALIANLQADDLVLCLLSGGGSSLLTYPVPGISLEDIQAMTSLLLNCGATIQEINTVRKHLDNIKGGGLAKFLCPARVVTLILSDVLGDDIGSIASGPTAADPTTYADSLSILAHYQLLDHTPARILSHLADGVDGRIPETVKPADPLLTSVTNIIVGNNEVAARAALNAAKSRGFTARLLTTSLHGEARVVGASLVDELKTMASEKAPGGKPLCLVAGGETTVTIKGDGKGGRNQELALGAVKELSGEAELILVSLATDGGDGITDAAGAVATNETYARGLACGLDLQNYLDRNDSYHYFEQLDDLIRTGPTLTNVNDLVLLFSL